MLIFRRLFLFHPVLALAAIVMAGKPALAREQPAKEFPIRAGTSIQKGENYTSQSGNHYLLLQDDGNLVVKSKTGGFVWGLNGVTQRYNQTARVELSTDGRFGAYDASGAPVWSPSFRPASDATLNLTFDGALQVVTSNGTILWSSDGNLIPPIKVFLIKADLTEDSSQLASEPGWAQCWVMRDPAIKIFATNNVSKSAINAVANIYVEMTHRLHPIYPRKEFDGFKVYITNEEYGAELKKLNTVKDMWEDGTSDDSRDWLLGGASTKFLWITEQMICKTGVKTRATIGRPDTATRTFDQVVHEFAHSIDLNFIRGRGNDRLLGVFNSSIGPVEGFAMAVQKWFGAANQLGPLTSPQEAQLREIFTSRSSFSPEGYGAEPSTQPAMPRGTSVADLQKAGEFPSGYFLMTTQFAEEQNLFLESTPLTLRARDRAYTGMNWKAVPAGDGYFYLTSQYLEESSQVLEGGDGKGAALMARATGVTGTRWKAVPAGDGYFYLTNLFLEKKGYVLEGNVGDINFDGKTLFKGLPHVVTYRASGTKWKFIPLQ